MEKNLKIIIEEIKTIKEEIAEEISILYGPIDDIRIMTFSDEICGQKVYNKIEFIYKEYSNLNTLIQELNIKLYDLFEIIEK